MASSRGDNVAVEAPCETAGRSRLLPLILVVGVVAAYANSLHGAFVFDDHRTIERSARIQQLWPPAALLSGHRPVVDLTLAINYAIHGLDVRGYHVVNIAIHLLAAMTLFGLTRRTLGSPRFGDRFDRAAPVLALTISLIWAVHPLQTQSVTYLIQRSESLMGLFYFLTLYCVARGTEGHRGGAWYAAAVASCALGMGCKSIILTAPIVVLLYDRVFLSRSWTEPIRLRWGLYVGLSASWVMLLLTRMAQHIFFLPAGAKAAVGFGFKGITPFEYAVTQFGVVAEYVRLSLWPHPLCLDYNWPVAKSIDEVLLPGVIVLALLALTVWALRRRPEMGFLGAWFFVILAPTSTIVPIRDPLFEHRMYLPLAAVVALVVVVMESAIRALVAHRGWSDVARRRISGGIVTALTIVLILATAARNRAYADKLTMWRDVAAKRPNHARAEYNIGTGLLDRGEIDEAIRWFQKAIESDPRQGEAYYNLGKAYAKQNRPDDAAAWYAKAIEIDPTMAEAHSDLGNMFVRAGRVDEAIQHYRLAIRAEPEYAPPYFNLSQVLLAGDQGGEAIGVLRAGVRARPSEPRLHFTLGQALQSLGRLDEAANEYRRTIRLDPGHAAARQALQTIPAPP